MASTEKSPGQPFPGGTVLGKSEIALSDFLWLLASLHPAPEDAICLILI
jgi:hypothetical protein